MRKGRKQRNKPRLVDPDDEELPEDEAFAAGDAHLQAFVPQELEAEEQACGQDDTDNDDEQAVAGAQGDFSMEALQAEDEDEDDEEEQEEEDDQTPYDDEEADGGLDEAAQKRILAAVSSHPGASRKRRRTVAGDALEGEFRSSSGSADVTLAADDLSAPLAENASFGSLKDKLARLQKVKPTPPPVSQTVTEREARAIAFDRAAAAVSRWQPIVKANREAAHLQFPINAPPSIGTSSSELAAKFEPRTDLEKKIVDVLDQSGLQGGAAAAYDELPDAGSLEQLQERQAQLSKMRNLLYYQELKWKRQKRIKSKSYHKVLKKEKQKRAALAEAESPEELALMAERARIRERFELRHKNQSRWARRLLSRGSLHNPANRRALEESAKIGQQLRKKMVSFDEDDGVEAFRHPSAERTGEELESDAGVDAKLGTDQTPTTGLLAMKFMQRAKPVVEDEEEEAASEQQDAPPPMRSRMTFTPGTQAVAGRLKADALQAPAQAPAPVRMQGAISVEADEAGVDPSNPWLRLPAEPPALASCKTSGKPKQPRRRPNASPEALPTKVDLPVLDVSFTLRPGAADNAQEQHDLIERAFPADHLEAEFAAAKEQERELEEPASAPALPGWGSWAGEGIASRSVPAPPKPKPKPRADDRLQHVVLNEKRDKKAARHRLDSVPHGYGSREHYERALRQPLGKEWNTAQSHRSLVLPRISVSAGQVIDPIKFSRKSYELLQAKTKKKQQPRAPLHL